MNGTIRLMPTLRAQIASPEANDKPIILTFTRYYLPGYLGGGPIRTLANMVERLSDDYQFLIVTMDRDMGERQPYANVKRDEWNQVGNAHVFYATPASLSLSSLARLIRETPHDVLYLNSFFDPIFSIRPLLAMWLRLVPRRPTLIAPRGEFSAGAFKLKRWKKAPYSKLGSMVGLFDGVVWHASTSLEAADIRRVLHNPAAEIRVAENIAVAPDLLQATSHYEPSAVGETAGSRLRVCFLSRIARKKNLDFALRVLALVKIPVRFSIFGPREDAEYWTECQHLISNLPANISVEYCGSVAHDEVRAVIAQHDLFFLPTHGENFGHVFLEAWSAGVPILVSDQTPWRSLAARGLGWDIPLDRPDEFVSALTTAAARGQAERSKSQSDCVHFAREKSDDIQALELNRALFRRFLARPTVVSVA
jgi:glycosyltransferase involved in cell wall biosynthesis